jgi:hypothetical protein
MAAGASTTAAASTRSEAVYVPPEPPAGWADASVPGTAQADVPPALAAAPPAAAQPLPLRPAPRAQPTPRPATPPQAGPQGSGSTDPGSRYLPLGEPVGGLPVETPPLGYR